MPQNLALALALSLGTSSALGARVYRGRKTSRHPLLSPWLRGTSVNLGKSSPEEVARWHFDICDFDSDGHITWEDVRNAMERLGQNATEAEAREGIFDIDLNLDGKISFDEFVAQASTKEPPRKHSRGSKLVVINGCPNEAIWIASMFRDNDRERYPNNIKLEPHETFTFELPYNKTIASTRFWPKMGCKPDGTKCRIGSSGGPGQDCPTKGCAPPVDTKFEATFWDKSTAQPVDWWDTSGVDGYTLPYTLTLDEGCPNGHDLDCSKLSLYDCPSDEILNGQPADLLVKFQGDEEPVGCFSHCGKLTFDNWGNGPIFSPASKEANPYCCPTPPVSSKACRAGPVEQTRFVKLFRKKCPGVYSYAYDDAVGLQTCPVGTTYTWTLMCPGPN